MPNNDNQNNTHKEGINSAVYNPNRPNTLPNSPSQTGSNNTEYGEHADTQKVVDTVAKGASEYFAPGVGGAIYDTAKNVPGVGDAIDNVTKTAAEGLDQVPGVKNASKILNETGATDAINQGISLIGNKGGAKTNAASASGKAINSPDSMPNMPGGKNNAMQARINRGQDLEDEGLDDDSTDLDANDEETAPSSDLPSEDLSDDLENNEDEQKTEGQTDILGRALKKFWSKHKIPIILAGGGVALFVFLLIIIMGAGDEGLRQSGYYDSVCNYNEASVNLTNCYDNASEREILGSYDLEEFVINMAYLYTQDGSYSDGAIQALMIAIKTNALGYGNYSSSDKEIEVRICDIYSEYSEDLIVDNESEANEENDGQVDTSEELENDEVSNEDQTDLDSDNADDQPNTDSETDENTTNSLFAGIEEVESRYRDLYDDISDYLYLSSSYTSAISSLSRRNVLELNMDKLTQFQTLASEGNDYEDILNAVYNVEEENLDEDENTPNEEESTPSEEVEVYEETIFVGDSRTNQMRLNGIIDDNYTVYGGGLGYLWFVGDGTFSASLTNYPSGGINGVNAIINEGTSYNIVIWLGVNDLFNINSYMSIYEELAQGEWSSHNIYIVSVGPVNDALASVTNASIDTFNDTMENFVATSGLNNLFYIDLEYSQDSIEYYDGEGLHYGASDYQAIHDIIMDNLGQVSLDSNYQLYDLADYCSYNTVGVNCATFPFRGTTLSKSEFVDLAREYITSTRTSTSALTFAQNLETVYDVSLEYNINPELVVVRAYLEGFSPGVSNNNYWGLGCYNGVSASQCLHYSSFRDGLIGFLENVNQYSSVEDMMTRYAYIGNYWFNPGSSGLGGCYYFPYVSEYMSENRAAVVANACNGASCSGSACLATTAEDQSAYTDYQVSIMSDMRTAIFGLSPGVCSINNLSSYNLLATTSNGLTDIINTTLSEALRARGSSVREYNEYILESVIEAGVGTRSGAVAAALSLVWTLYDSYGIRLPYTMCGQHYCSNLFMYGTGSNVNRNALSFYGVDPNWGVSLGTYYYGSYKYTNYGPDCSGFVSWVLHNGGVRLNSVFTVYANAYLSLDMGPRYAVASSFVGQPGDIMTTNSHVLFIVGVDEGNRLYYVAHASGGSSGVKISTISFSDTSHYIIDMTDYYNNNAQYTSEREFEEAFRAGYVE